MFGSLEAARAQWRQIYDAVTARGQEVQLGAFIAELDLQPNEGFDMEDLHEPDGHLTVWGDPARLAQAVRRTYAALTEGS
jgi:hypothetical protein